MLSIVIVFAGTHQIFNPGALNELHLSKLYKCGLPIFQEDSTMLHMTRRGDTITLFPSATKIFTDENHPKRPELVAEIEVEAQRAYRERIPSVRINGSDGNMLDLLLNVAKR